ncbi:MAG: RyR domain-containing protein [Acidobacteriota bacterium]
MSADLDFDQIAAWIHGYYQAANPDTVYAEFDKLPEFLKVDNRDAACRIGTVLAMAGLRLEDRNGRDWPPDEQHAIRKLIEDNLALLAEAEHDGWVESRVRNGWTAGDRKDIDGRLHHLLVPYTELAAQVARKQAAAGPATREDGTPMSVDEEVEAEKDKDRNSVRTYVDIIARTSYRIVQEA